MFRRMQIVMIKTTKKVGKVGEVLDVKRGYAINFLIPQGFALPADKGFVKEAKSRARKYEKSSIVEAADMTGFIKELDGLELVIKGKANEKGGLFSSIRAEDIAEELAKKLSRSIDYDYIVLKEPIKKIGEHQVEVVAGEAKGKLMVKVEAGG